MFDCRSSVCRVDAVLPDIIVNLRKFARECFALGVCQFAQMELFDAVSVGKLPERRVLVGAVECDCISDGMDVVNRVFLKMFGCDADVVFLDVLGFALRRPVGVQQCEDGDDERDEGGYNEGQVELAESLVV